MELFLQTSMTFPVVVLSFLLCIAILYWLVAALGLVEVDLLDIEVDSALEGDSLQPEGLAGLLMKLGLNGVPVTLVLTLLFFFAWILCYFAELLLLRWLPLGILRYPLGLLLIPASLLMAAVPARVLVRPLRPLFHKLQATDSRSIIGQVAVVRSGSVSTRHGEADFNDGGAGLILRIRADEGLALKRGDRVVLLEYLADEHAYRVVTEAEFNGS